MTLSLHTACHRAHLDPLTGIGLLVLPLPCDDVRDPKIASQSLHSVDWSAMLRVLDRHGWEPLEDDENGGLIHEGQSSTGRQLVALYSREPIHEGFDPLGWQAAHETLRQRIG